MRKALVKSTRVNILLPEYVYNTIRNDCGMIPVATYITNLLCIYADEVGCTEFNEDLVMKQV